MNPWNTFYETVFEYERKINFPKLTSRYQSFFAIENLDDFSYWADTFQTSEEMPVWKVEVQESDIFRGDASWLILGDFDQSVLRLAYNARQYWTGNPRPNYNQLPELLISGNMRLVERIK